MMPVNANPARGWSALLEEPDGPASRYGDMLELMRGRVGQPTGAGELVLARKDEPLAAVAVIRGAGAARPFAEAAGPIVARVGRKLAIPLASVDPLSLLILLSFTTIGETVGATLPAPAFDVDRRLDELLVNKNLSPPDRATLGFLLLDHGRPADVRSIVSQSREARSGDRTHPVTLIKTLAAALGSRAAADDVEPAWDGFVRGFPAALHAETAEWRHLLLAARLVLAKLGPATVTDVADSLHRRVVALAAEEAS